MTDILGNTLPNGKPEPPINGRTYQQPRSNFGIKILAGVIGSILVVIPFIFCQENHTCTVQHDIVHDTVQVLKYIEVPGTKMSNSTQCYDVSDVNTIKVIINNGVVTVESGD